MVRFRLTMSKLTFEKIKDTLSYVEGSLAIL